MTSLSSLLDAVMSGETRALGELVGRFAPTAHRLARSLLRSESLAEDAVQDAFVIALRRLPTLREPEAFPAWFRQVVRTAADRIARRRREAPLPAGDEPADARAGPPADLIRREVADAVREAVARLPPAGRACVECFYLQERSVAEVAGVLQVPPGTVRRRLFDARARLAILLIGNPGAWSTLNRESGT
jgi:RNA polymerase sigma-70 factor (ECF subfamily)